jgi:hypothetical protein
MKTFIGMVMFVGIIAVLVDRAPRVAASELCQYRLGSYLGSHTPPGRDPVVEKCAMRSWAGGGLCFVASLGPDGTRTTMPIPIRGAPSCEVNQDQLMDEIVRDDPKSPLANALLDDIVASAKARGR